MSNARRLNNQSVHSGEPVESKGVTQVAEGVEFEAFGYVGNTTKDTGIGKILPGFATPRQEVLFGDTTEEYIDGEGELVIRSPRYGSEVRYRVRPGIFLSANVMVGEEMQWIARQDAQNPLMFRENSTPPYTEGKFRNL